MPVRRRHHHTAQYGSGGGGKGGFNPTSIPNLVAWYKADSIALNNDDLIDTWVDSSSSGYTLTAALTGRPTFKANIVNGKPVARFDGVVNQMKSGAITEVTDDYTQFLVTKPSATGTPNDFVFSLSSGDTGQSMVYGFEASKFEAFTTPRVDIGTYDGSNFAIYEVVDDDVNRIGLMNGTQTESVGAGAAAQADGPITLGSADGTAYYTGDIAEFLWYGVGLSSGDRSTIRTYLGLKYGIAVS